MPLQVTRIVGLPREVGEEYAESREQPMHQLNRKEKISGILKLCKQTLSQ